MHLMVLIMALPLVALLLFVVLPFPAALVGYLCSVAIAAVGFVLMWRSSRLPVRTGDRGLVGETAIVAVWRDGRGEVHCHGEVWQAEAAGSPLRPGDRVRVAAVHDLALEVVKLPEADTHG